MNKISIGISLQIKILKYTDYTRNKSLILQHYKSVNITIIKKQPPWEQKLVWYLCSRFQNCEIKTVLFKIKLNRSCKDDFTDSILKDNSFKSYACTR